MHGHPRDAGGVRVSGNRRSLLTPDQTDRYDALRGYHLERGQHNP